MKIIWNPNPLCTTVDVDDVDRERMCMFLQNEAYTNLLCDITFELENKDKPPLSHEEILRRASKWRKICDMDETHSEIQALVTELQYSHGGDCTCWAASCMKCFAETALGINTIKGLGKHEASKIMDVFEHGATIDDALAALDADKDYIKPDTWPASVGWEEYIPRWEAERVRAHAWLLNYKEEHNF